ncbi:MAG: carboxymuconolactone decarboxylase family protein [Maricaulaceae bacterium]
MSLETLREALPDYAKDIKLNLSTLARETGLSDQQKWGCFLACAYAIGQPDVIAALNAETADRLEDAAKTAAKAAAAIMGMNNVYYRATHLIQNPDYAQLPAKLRMNVIGNPGVDKVDFELWSLAVSAINGCGMCLDSHEAVLIKAGLGKDKIQTGLRIAAVVNAASRVIVAERAASV